MQSSTLSSEHCTQDALEANPVWADSEPPSAEPELSLQHADRTRLRVTAAPHTADAMKSLLLGVCRPRMDSSLARVCSSTMTDAVNRSWSNRSP